MTHSLHPSTSLRHSDMLLSKVRADSSCLKQAIYETRYSLLRKGIYPPMERLRRVVNNTLISLLGQSITWTSTLLLTIAYGRFLGDVKFGELYFALTFVLLIGVPLEYSFDQQATRDVAQEPSLARRYFSNILLMKGGLWLVLYSVTLLACRLLGYSAEEQVLVAISGLTLLGGSISNTAGSLHYAFERAFLPVIGSILEKGLAALFGILLLRQGAGVQVMALVLLGGALVSAIWQVAWFFRLVGVTFVLDVALMRALLRTSIPFLIYGVLGVIYYRIDTVLLSLMATTAAVGWYGAGYRLFDALSFLPGLLNPIMFPIFSRLATTSEAGLGLAVEKTLNFLLFFAVPISTGLIVVAPNIVSFLYQRPEFNHTIPALQALAPGLVLLYINTVLGTILVSMKREKRIPIMAAIALVFNLGLNFVMIPRYEHVGAAIVTSLTEFLLLCLSLMFTPRQLLPLGSLRVGIKAVIASFVMTLAIWFLPSLNVFIILSIASLVYFGAATLLCTIPREDIQALYRAIRYKTQPISPAALAHQTAEEFEEVP